MTDIGKSVKIMAVNLVYTIMTQAEKQLPSRRERFQQALHPLHGDPSSSGEYLRHLQDLEDFDRRFTLIESHYANAYELVQQLEVQIESCDKKWQKYTLS